MVITRKTNKKVKIDSVSLIFIDCKKLNTLILDVSFFSLFVNL